jgi:hypothetical protein
MQEEVVAVARDGYDVGAVSEGAARAKHDSSRMADGAWHLHLAMP